MKKLSTKVPIISSLGTQNQLMTKSRMPSVLLYVNLSPPQALFTNLHCLNIARLDRSQIAMKNLFFSMLFLLPFLFCLANINGAAVPCSTVDSKAAACLGFATGKAPKPTPDCCSGLQDLAKTVKTVDDKKAICKCLKAAGGSLGVKYQFVSRIPGACNFKVGFPVSISVNCDAIH